MRVSSPRTVGMLESFKIVDFLTLERALFSKYLIFLILEFLNVENVDFVLLETFECLKSLKCDFEFEIYAMKLIFICASDHLGFDFAPAEASL